MQEPCRIFIQILSLFISDFLHNFPGHSLHDTFEQDDDDIDDGELVEEYKNGFEPVDREDTSVEDDIAAVVKDSNSESDCSSLAARVFSRSV